MGMCLIEDGVIGSVIMENLHNPLHVASLLRSAEEFAIGERAGSSFAKAIIGLRMDAFVFIDASDIHFSFAYGFSSFDDEGSDAVFDECECGKEPSRPCSDDYDLPWCVAHIGIDGC